jgi:hypothetical protein
MPDMAMGTATVGTQEATETAANGAMMEATETKVVATAKARAKAKAKERARARARARVRARAKARPGQILETEAGDGASEAT